MGATNYEKVAPVPALPFVSQQKDTFFNSTVGCPLDSWEETTLAWVTAGKAIMSSAGLLSPEFYQKANWLNYKSGYQSSCNGTSSEPVAV